MGIMDYLKRRTTKPAGHPTLDDLAKLVVNFINDDELQNSKIHSSVKALMHNIEVNEMPGGFGEFGRTPSNPIPVNGPFGEVLYLSRLSTERTGHLLFSHRLGSIGKVDVYETVSMYGSDWDILFLYFYYPKKSNKAPSGYRIVENDGRSLISGTNRRVKEFPYGIADAVSNFTKSSLGIPMVGSEVRIAEQDFRLERDSTHISKLNVLAKYIRYAPHDESVQIYQDKCHVCGKELNKDLTHESDDSYQQKKRLIDDSLADIGKEYILKCPYCGQLIRSDSNECPLCSMFIPNYMFKEIPSSDNKRALENGNLENDKCILCNI